MLTIVVLPGPQPSRAAGDASAGSGFRLPAATLACDSVAQALRQGSGDIVLVRAGTLLGPDWEQDLAAAALVDDRTATVSALVLEDAAQGFAENAVRVRANALRLRPALPAPAGPCVLLRREALELVGWDAGEPADDAMSLTAFAAACTATGLLHVLADELLASAPPADRPGVSPATGDGPPARTRAVARRAIDGLSVTVDARLLDGPSGGSQVHTLALITALAATTDTRLRVLLGPEPSAEAQAALSALDITTLSYDDALRGAPRTRVVHRPMQVYTPDDMSLLRLVGERIVVTHHDAILYHNPTYFPDDGLWRSYRRVTRQALAEADRIVLSTRHARDEALRDELVTQQRSVVVALGTDHAPSATQAAPATLRAATQRPFLLCLGSDLRHKNRPFAIELARALTELGWNGRLVLAGARARHGSSAPQEAELLARWPQAADVVLTLDHVSEAEREWLMTRCAAVVFTSVSEGFGLPPFEAAQRGVPCLFAARSAMAELLPEAAASIVPWDARASARHALALLEDPAARARHIELMRGAARPLTWQRFAAELSGVYEDAARSPARAVSVLVTAADERELALRGLNDYTVDLRDQLDALGPDALRLVGRHASLPSDVQRALLAAVARRATRTPLFALLRAGYRAGHRRR